MSLIAENLTVRAGGCSLIAGISLEARAGEFLAILGPNGAGKSTLLHALAGGRMLATGEVRLDGRALVNWQVDALARQRAFLMQAVELHFPFSVREVVTLGRLPHGDAHPEVVEAALAQLGLTGLAERSYLTLSGGERQRVHLARALAQIWPGEATGTRVLLLDEPTNNLDARHQQETLRLARAWADAGAVVVAILHDWNLALAFAHRAALLCRGELAVPPGPVAEVLTAEHLRTVFGLGLQTARTDDGQVFLLPK